MSLHSFYSCYCFTPKTKRGTYRLTFGHHNEANLAYIVLRRQVTIHQKCTENRSKFQINTHTLTLGISVFPFRLRGLVCDYAACVLLLFFMFIHYSSPSNMFKSQERICRNVQSTCRKKHSHGLDRKNKHPLTPSRGTKARTRAHKDMHVLCRDIEKVGELGNIMFEKRFIVPCLSLKKFKIQNKA